MSSINYSAKMPNNVNLAEDRTLQRALEHGQPNYLSWWNDMGPEGSQDFDVYLRTAVSVDPQGWAQFGHVKMPDYRWGIFLNPAEQNRKLLFNEDGTPTARTKSIWGHTPMNRFGESRELIGVFVTSVYESKRSHKLARSNAEINKWYLADCIACAR